MKIISIITLVAYLSLVTHVLNGHEGGDHAEPTAHHSVKIELTSDNHRDDVNHAEHPVIHQYDGHSETHQHDQKPEYHQHNIQLLRGNTSKPLVHQSSITSSKSPSNNEWGKIKINARQYTSIWCPRHVYLHNCMFLV